MRESQIERTEISDPRQRIERDSRNRHDRLNKLLDKMKDSLADEVGRSSGNQKEGEKFADNFEGYFETVAFARQDFYDGLKNKDNKKNFADTISRDDGISRLLSEFLKKGQEIENKRLDELNKAGLSDEVKKIDVVKLGPDQIPAYFESPQTEDDKLMIDDDKASDLEPLKDPLPDIPKIELSKNQRDFFLRELKDI